MDRSPRLKVGSTLLVFAGLLLATLTAARAAETTRVTLPGPPADLRVFLEPLREKYRFPALAAAVVDTGRTIAVGAVGLRKNGGTQEVTLADLFPIGSCTKSMTATLAARLVEQNKIQWHTSLGEVFPEWRTEMHADYHGVTLEQLLSHRGGVPSDLQPNGLWATLWRREGTPREQRLRLLRSVTARPPTTAPGTTFTYANAGVALAGAMLEKVAQQDWELLITTQLFTPLDMTSAGFGAPGTADQEDQPWGHTRTQDVLTSRAPGPMSDNPPAIAPAGTVHCSIVDLAKYVALHAHGNPHLLLESSRLRLHTPVAASGYALGWNVVERPWGGGQVIHHDGSNTQNYTSIWIAPKKDFGVMVATNVAGTGVAAACDQIVGALIQKYLSR